MLALSLVLFLQGIILKQLMFTVKTPPEFKFSSAVGFRDRKKSDLFFTNLSQRKKILVFLLY